MIASVDQQQFLKCYMDYLDFALLGFRYFVCWYENGKNLWQDSIKSAEFFLHKPLRVWALIWPRITHFTILKYDYVFHIKGVT